jgi:outer membrane protein assembly factor BamB
VYAQPLIVGDRVVIATENDTVYALRAADGTIEWKTHLGEPVRASSLPCGNVDPVGITSTPVVDPGSNRVYTVGMVQPGRHVLFALALDTGRRVSSTRVDADGADPAVHNQRGALTLANGNVYVPYGGRLGDCGDYHGRVVMVPVDGTTLGTPRSYTLPTQRAGGFWAPPGAVVASDGTLYLASGNSFDNGTHDYGNSVVHLSADLKLLDAFAPRNWKALDATDGDVGSTSPVLLPDGRVFQVGKAGVGYLLDAENFSGPGDARHEGNVCDSSAFGGSARDGTVVYVPCTSGVVQVTVTADTFTVGWNAPLHIPGPTIVAGGAVWTVASGSGTLVALDPGSGKVRTSQEIGSVPSRFVSPAAGGGRVVVAADATVFAFGS